MGKPWFNRYGHLQRRIPKQCVSDCIHPGSCDADIDYWRKRLQFKVPRALAVSYLKEFGAWDDLNRVSDDVLAERVLWTACGDIAEQGQWYGLVH